MFTIDLIREVLQKSTYRAIDFKAHPTCAAVAMILADGDEDLEVCFIRRAEREGDPWSGQVAFPGGRAESTDVDAYAVAERETWEEVGLILEREHRLGPLPTRAINRGDLREPMTLSPFVYYIDETTKSTAFARIPEEVAQVFWVPLKHLFDEDSVTELEYPIAENWNTYPGIQFGEHVIWGLTLRVIDSFAELADFSLPALK